MLNIAIKFCGGCNPRFDRVAAYNYIKEQLSDCALFETPEENKVYDVLLVITGCGACHYEYEEISTEHRLYLVHDRDIDNIINTIKELN